MADFAVGLPRIGTPTALQGLTPSFLRIKFRKISRKLRDLSRNSDPAILKSGRW
jgi:hypothetical protein